MGSDVSKHPLYCRRPVLRQIQTGESAHVKLGRVWCISMGAPIADHIVRHGLVEYNQWLTALGRLSLDERFVTNHENIDLAHHDRQHPIQLIEFLSHGP